MKDIIIKQSKLHGKGVFAARDFKKGEIVLKWTSKKLLTKDELKKLPPNELEYVSYFKNGKYILLGPPARYVNHSCESNTKAIDGAEVAKRDIKKGEEITADYTNEGIPFEFGCKCGSKDCKGTIGSELCSR